MEEIKGDITEGDITEDGDKKRNSAFRKIERRTKYKHRYSGNIRVRNICPICNSLNVTKRIKSKDYKCYNCKWTGKDVNRMMA